MSDTVAIVGIASPVVLGIAGLWFGARREDLRLRQQTRTDRIRELNEVLDEGGQAITEALFASDRRLIAAESERKAKGEAFDQKVERVLLVEDRIAIRLGTGAQALGSYQTAARELQHLSRLLFEARGNELSGEQKGEAEQARAEVERGQREFFDRARLWLAVGDEGPRRRGGQERLRELDEILELASESLTEALFAFDRRRAAVPARLSITGKAFDASVERVQLMENRLAVRLGPDDRAAESYRRAVRGLQVLARLVYEAHGEELVGEAAAEAEGARAGVESAHRDFIARARR